MTILVGSDVTTGYTNTSVSMNGGYLYLLDNEVLANGTADTLGWYFYDLNEKSVKLLLFTGTGTLLHATSPISTGAPGIITGTIPGQVMTLGQTYYIGVTAESSGPTFYTDGQAWHGQAIQPYSYTTPTDFNPANVISLNLGFTLQYAASSGGGGGGPVTLALPNTGGATTSTAARGTQTPNLAVPL